MPLSCNDMHPDAYGDDNIKPGVCFLVDATTTGPYLDARAFCRGLGGALAWDIADLEDPEELKIIVGAVANKGVDM